MPKRIQLRRTKGWRLPDGAVHVARPSRWGNPWTMADATRRHVRPARRQQWLVDQFLTTVTPEFTSAVREQLAGKDLACWCPLDQPCHGDVLLELANGRPA